jgi:hypothetical protein
LLENIKKPSGADNERMSSFPAANLYISPGASNSPSLFSNCSKVSSFADNGHTLRVLDKELVAPADKKYVSRLEFAREHAEDWQDKIYGSPLATRLG